MPCKLGRRFLSIPEDTKDIIPTRIRGEFALAQASGAVRWKRSPEIKGGHGKLQPRLGPLGRGVSRQNVYARWGLVAGMRERTAWGALVLTIALLAAGGCLGLGENGGDETELPGSEEGEGDETPVTLDWWLSNCHAVVGIVPVDEQALADHLPEGFEPVSAEEALDLPPDPRGDGALGFETFHCESASGLDGNIDEVGYAALFAPVEPPEDLEHPDAEVLFYKWETLVPDEDRRNLFIDRGLPAVDGSTDLSGFEDTPAGFVFDVSATLDGFTFELTGSATAPNEDFREGFSFLEFQEAQGGFATWLSTENEANRGNSGTGTVSVDSSHWTSDVIGSSEDQAYIVATPEVNFLEGQIQLPG